MGLKETQDLLVRLYVDPQVRSAYRDNPAAISDSFGLTDDETRQLDSLCNRQVAAFAHSLHLKRLGEVRGLLPLTFKALGERFAELFLRFVHTGAPSTGVKRHQKDAIAFAEWLQNLEPCEIPAWVSDLAEYEAVWITVHQVGACLLLKSFGHNLRSAIAELNRDAVPDKRPRQRTLGIWIRLWEPGRGRHFVVPVGLPHRDSRH